MNKAIPMLIEAQRSLTQALSSTLHQDADYADACLREVLEKCSDARVQLHEPTDLDDGEAARTLAHVDILFVTLFEAARDAHVETSVADWVAEVEAARGRIRVRHPMSTPGEKTSSNESRST